MEAEPTKNGGDGLLTDDNDHGSLENGELSSSAEVSLEESGMSCLAAKTLFHVKWS